MIAVKITKVGIATKKKQKSSSSKSITRNSKIDQDPNNKRQ